MKYNAEEFYPTPRSIITEMLSGVNLDTIHTVLEPSAGKGDIVKYLQSWEKTNCRHGFDISYRQCAFANAERKSDVEIAIIKVRMLKSEYESIVLDRLRKAQELRPPRLDADVANPLVSSDKIRALIEHYTAEAEAGITLIREYCAVSYHFGLNTPLYFS